MDDAVTGDRPISFTSNRVTSTAPLFYQTKSPFALSANEYHYTGDGQARFTLGDKVSVTLAALQAAGLEKGSTLENCPATQASQISLRVDATIGVSLDADGLLKPEVLAQLVVLRSLATQYRPGALAVTVHLREPANPSREQVSAIANALRDFDAPQIHFVQGGQTPGLIRLSTTDGHLLEKWQGFQNAATLGGAVRKQLGRPRFAEMRGGQ